MSISQTAREGRIRRRLARDGQRLWKVRSDSRWSAEFGPCAVVDIAGNWVGQRGITLDDLEQQLTA
jgi:hypothetical protein